MLIWKAQEGEFVDIKALIASKHCCSHFMMSQNRKIIRNWLVWMTVAIYGIKTSNLPKCAGVNWSLVITDKPCINNTMNCISTTAHLVLVQLCYT